MTKLREESGQLPKTSDHQTKFVDPQKFDFFIPSYPLLLISLTPILPVVSYQIFLCPTVLSSSIEVQFSPFQFLCLLVMMNDFFNHVVFIVISRLIELLFKNTIIVPKHLHLVKHDQQLQPIMQTAYFERQLVKTLKKMDVWYQIQLNPTITVPLVMEICL